MAEFAKYCLLRCSSSIKIELVFWFLSPWAVLQNVLLEQTENSRHQIC